jgi:heme A synthase
MLQWHRWLGIAATVLAAGAAWVAYKFASSENPRGRWLRRSAVWLTALVLSVAAHLGALMVWGEDYFSPSA